MSQETCTANLGLSDARPFFVGGSLVLMTAPLHFFVERNVSVFLSELALAFSCSSSTRLMDSEAVTEPNLLKDQNILEAIL